MNQSTLKKWAIAGAFVFAILLMIGMFVSANNTAVTLEEGIVASYKNNENILSNYGKKVQEVAQVPSMYVDDLTKVTKATMQGRYGTDGSKAVFQFLKETNIPLNDKMYVQIQQVIESGRNDFQNGQSMLIDKVRVYKTLTRTFPKSFFLSTLGFPKIDLNQYDIVIDDRTANVFQSKREEALTLRKKD